MFALIVVIYHFFSFSTAVNSLYFYDDPMHACNLLYLLRLVYHQQFVTSGSLKIEVLCYARGLTLLHQDPQQIATDFPISLLHKTWTLTCCKLKLQRHVTTCYAVKQKSSE